MSIPDRAVNPKGKKQKGLLIMRKKFYKKQYFDISIYLRYLRYI